MVNITTNTLIPDKFIIPTIPFWIRKQLNRPCWKAHLIIKALFTPDKKEKIINEIKKVTGCSKVILYESGTSALYHLLRGRVEKKEVIMPSYCCKSVANAVIQAGLTPHFVDVEDDFMISARTIKNAVNEDTLAIIVPHMYNGKADVESIMRAFPEIVIIEDKANRAQDELVAPYGILSFNIGKQIQSTGGGALLKK